MTVVMSTHSVKTHLGVSAGDYDQAIRDFVPYYDEFLNTAVALLKKLIPEDAQIVDLGGGTGGLTAAIVKGLPNVRVQIVDVDSQMLTQAQERLKAYSPRVSFLNASFFDPLPKADAYVASLSLHHIHDLKEKTKVYHSIWQGLNPGGLFLNLDAVVSEDSALTPLAMNEWASKMEERGIALPAALQHLKSWKDEDRYFSIFEELTSLKNAGFPAPECFWRRLPMAVYGGRKGGHTLARTSTP